MNESLLPSPSRSTDASSVDEERRLAVLRAYGVLDTPRERAFDDLTRLAAEICGAPIAVVSLVDRARQWFKSAVGIDAVEVPREVSFCSQAIETPERPLVVRDAADDPRFAQNPLVTGDPHVRFYAGVPLVVPTGEALGALCVIDRVPRELSEAQLEALATLSRQVIAHLELRSRIRSLELVAEERDELVRTLEAFRRVIDITSDGILTGVRWDDTARVATLNPAAARLLGFADPAEAIGMDWLEIVTPAGRELLRGEATDALERSGEWSGALELRRFDDAARSTVVDAHLAIFDDHEAGQRARVLVLLRDATRARAAAVARRELLGTVSHELRTPLAGIIGAVELLTRGAGGPLPPKAAEIARLAGENAARLVTLVDDLVDDERASDEGVSIPLSDVDLVSLVTEAVTRFSAYASRFGVGVVVRAAAPNALVRGHAGRIEQVLANLLSNAAKFSPRGGQIVVEVHEDAASFRVNVRDEGPGVAPSLHPRVFERFAQGAGAATVGVASSGLGLHISKALVRRMGGDIDFEREPGKGACFYFRLPRVAP